MSDEIIGASPAPSEVAASTTPEAPTGQSEQSSAQPVEAPAAAAPSEDKQDAPPKSALDAVMKGMERERTAAVDKADGQQPESPANPDAKADQAKPEAGDKQQQQPKPKDANTRIRELVHVNKRLGERAKNWDEFSGWVSGNGLTQDDVMEGLELMRLLRQNPTEAAKRLQPILEYVRPFTGEALPDDIQQMLDDGRMDERAARELAARRTQDSFRTQQDAETRQRVQQQQAQQRQHAEIQQHSKAVHTSVAQWESQWRGSDPDYSKKQPLVSAKISHLMMTTGAPPTPEAAVALAKRAREEVERELSSMLPRARSVNTPTGGSAQPTVTMPKSSLDAARQALVRG